MREELWQWLLKHYYDKAKQISAMPTSAMRNQEAQALLSWLPHLRRQLPDTLHHFTQQALQRHRQTLQQIMVDHQHHAPLDAMRGFVFQVPHHDDLQAMRGAYAGLNEDQATRLASMSQTLRQNMTERAGLIDSHHHALMIEYAFPWQLICHAIRSHKPEWALQLFDSIQSPLKSALLQVHDINYIKHLISECAHLQDGQNKQIGPDLRLGHLGFEVIINDLLGTINANFAVHVNVGLPGHHAQYSHGQGFCFINRNLVLTVDEYLRADNNEHMRVLLLGLDVNQDNGSHQILSETAFPLSSLHIDVCDTRVYPHPVRQENAITITLNDNNSHEYHLIDLAQPKHQPHDIHPAMIAAIQRVKEQLKSANQRGEMIILNILLGWDSHQDEEAACGAVVNGHHRMTVAERRMHRFSDDDFLYFYSKLALLLSRYNNNLQRTLIQIEGGYTPQVYQQQIPILLEALRLYEVELEHQPQNMQL